MKNYSINQCFRDSKRKKNVFFLGYCSNTFYLFMIQYKLERTFNVIN